MVWAEMYANGKTSLIFAEKGVKINKKNYVQDILEAVVLPWSNTMFGQEQRTFQQDLAPSHRAKFTQEWSQANFQGSYHLKNGLPNHQTLTPWTILSG